MDTIIMIILIIIGVKTIAGLLSIIITTSIIIWLKIKIKKLEEIVYSFPTPEELAKEILKSKLPISELPPEIQAQYMKPPSHLIQSHEMGANTSEIPKPSSYHG